MKLAPGTVVADRFRLVRELGEGGMGAVWLAHHEKLEMPCAVKFIHADVAEAAGVKERFEREAKVAGQIKSPHVVQVLDYGIEGDVPYIAMEYLEGEDLAHRLDARGRLGADETLAIVAQIARALTKAHQAGLVHRDLKPENVFLVKDDDREMVKVLDFGIAKVNSPIETKTKTGALLGTPRFMSPEQAQGQKDLDHRSDLWSLGVIGYRAIVGHLPFDSDAIGDLMMRIIVHPLPVPSQILPGLPPSFDAWWFKAAARDPAQRFQSAKELAEALATAFGSGAAAAPAVSAVTPLQTPDPHAYTRLASSPSNPGPSAPTPLPANPTPQPNYGSSFTPAPAMMAQTLGAASRTFNAPTKKRTSGAAIVGVAVLALAAGGTAAAVVLKNLGGSTNTAAQPTSLPSGATPAPESPPKPEPPRVDVAPAPAPSAEPTSAPVAEEGVDQAPARESQRPATRRSPPAERPHPPPARSGKVRIRP